MQHRLSQPELDPIDTVRATVAMLSVTGENIVREVHIVRIQEIISRIGLPSQEMSRALEEISKLREVEHLGQGYWLPTPTRTVALDDTVSLLVSIASTTELQRHFSSVRRAGLGRLVASSHVNDLPSQSLNSWLGPSEFTAEQLARARIKSAKNPLSPSTIPVDLEGFSVKTVRFAEYSSSNKPAWLPVRDHIIPGWSGVTLFRSRIAQRRYRYFLGSISNSRMLLEGPVVTDNLAMQYGLASLLGKPLTVGVHKQANGIRIALPLPAPKSVRQMLSALCEVYPNRFGYAWLCRQVECWRAVSTSIKSLSCEISDYE